MFKLSFGLRGKKEQLNEVSSIEPQTLSVFAAVEKMGNKPEILSAVEDYKEVYNSIMQGGVFLNDSQRIVTAENNLFIALQNSGVTLEPELTSAGFDNTLPAFVALFT